MTKVVNKATCPVWVKGICLNPGQELDVDGREDWENNLFVLSGSLLLVKPEKKKPKAKAKANEEEKPQ